MQLFTTSVQAAIAADSHLRIYECLDPSSSGLASWSLLEDIDLLTLPNAYYSPSSQGSHIHASHHSQQTQLIKGFDDAQQGSGSRSSLGPSGGSSISLGAQSTSSTGSASKNIGRIESSGAWAVSYCQEAWWGECVAVSAGSQGLIRVRQRLLQSESKCSFHLTHLFRRLCTSHRRRTGLK